MKSKWFWWARALCAIVRINGLLEIQSSDFPMRSVWSILIICPKWKRDPLALAVQITIENRWFDDVHTYFSMIIFHIVWLVSYTMLQQQRVYCELRTSWAKNRFHCRCRHTKSSSSSLVSIFVFEIVSFGAGCVYFAYFGVHNFHQINCSVWFGSIRYMCVLYYCISLCEEKPKTEK